MNKIKVVHILNSVGGVDVSLRIILENIDNQNLQAALLKLASQQRETLCLVVMSGLSYAETAKVMEVPIGTVMSRLSKARGSLAQMLKVKSGGKQ